MSQVRLLRTVMLVTVGAFVWACGDDDDEEEFVADLNVVAEIPTPTGNSTASGVADIELEDHELEVELNVQGLLTSGVTMAHIHGPATATATAPIILDFAPAMAAAINAGARTGTLLSAEYDLDAMPVSATGTLRVHPDSLITWLRDGRAYVNVHTTTNPSGEIRGQVRRIDD